MEPRKRPAGQSGRWILQQRCRCSGSRGTTPRAGASLKHLRGVIWPRTNATMSMQLASVPAPNFTGNGRLCMVRGSQKDRFWRFCQTATRNSSVPCRHATHNSNDLQRLHLVYPLGVDAHACIDREDFFPVILQRGRLLLPSLFAAADTLLGRFGPREPPTICLPKRVGGRRPATGPRQMEFLSLVADHSQYPPPRVACGFLWRHGTIFSSDRRPCVLITRWTLFPNYGARCRRRRTPHFTLFYIAHRVFKELSTYPGPSNDQTSPNIQGVN